MEEEAVEEVAAGQPVRVRGRHIKKRALKNKALSVSFNEKDLTDFVTGFHKRKKKRRKEAQQKLEEAERRKRIEARKKRKLERDFALHGGLTPDEGAEVDERGEDDDEEEESEPTALVSGTTMYDAGDVKVTVTTSEIFPDEENERVRDTAPRSSRVFEKKPQSIPVSKMKSFKKVSRKRSHPKPQNKRDRKKGKKKNKRH